MSQRDQPTREAAEARGAEHRENLALTDARRAEEEVAKAQKAEEQAAAEVAKLSRKERREREKAERVHAEADRARASVAEAQQTSVSTASGASVDSAGGGAIAGGFPGLDRLPPAAQRPEVLVGAAFAGSFIIARILKRIFD